MPVHILIAAFSLTSTEHLLVAHSQTGYVILQTVLLSGMFAATLVSTSLHKQSFLWRALELEDFAVFITRSSAVFTGTKCGVGGGEGALKINSI